MELLEYTPRLLYVVVVVVVAVVIYTLSSVGPWRKGRADFRLPPGPKAVPLLGNVHQLPLQNQHKFFSSWSSKYGDVIFAQLFRTPTIIINSFQVAQDLLDKKSSKYSYRPRFVLLAELMGWDNVITHMTYGERFRKHRRWIADAFQNKDSLKSYRPLQYKETYILLSGLLQNPGDVRLHLRRFAAAMIMKIAYGHTVTSIDDKYIHIAESAAKETVEAGGPGSMLVDFFPFLTLWPLWFPGAGFKRKAFEVRALVRNMLDTPFNMVKNAMLSGTASPCFTASLLEEMINSKSPTEEDEDDIKGAAGVLYGASTDTTVAVLSTFVLAMVLHPDVYKKAQEEVDRVVGSDRLPVFEDRISLPYLECVIREVYRWNCPVPLGIPHKVMQDDSYRDYDIPGGSMVIPNIWAMVQDHEHYPAPESFRPERFLEMSHDVADTRDPRNMVFGFGRRACPGKQFADTSIWLVVANMIATLDISKTTDFRGDPVTPQAAFISGFVSHPEPFVCNVAPRSDKIAEMVSELNANAVV
ncbi:uncharacterized protein FIBRA_01850 [Fibroporia radiculosa]|uniref:Cytochrome P450 n=1 Tax=Fibroporia radiculosa TaxID=599839 RepID=J4I8Q6_9APHY|nr:uncharacterized protein FIBRA_01850 [Fibroporia radiculosa]CCL99826.1 predicted protein [Fibroporia radiculosa]